MILDLVQESARLRLSPRSELEAKIAKAEALLTLYRSFAVQVGCTINAIERTEQAFDHQQAVDVVMSIGVGNIRAALNQIIARDAQL